MAADGGRDTEDVQSSAITCQVQHKDEVLSPRQASTAIVSNSCNTLSSSSSSHVSAVSILPPKSPNSVCVSLRTQMPERIQGDEEKCSSPTDYDGRSAFLPLSASTGQISVLNPHLVMLQQRVDRQPSANTPPHSAIIPFRRIDLMLSSNYNRDDSTSNCSDDLCQSITSLNSTKEKCRSGDYQERRRKNNDAAKRSREARRMKEAQNRTRMVHLEEENTQLRIQIDALRGQLNHMQLLLMASKATHYVP